MNRMGTHGTLLYDFDDAAVARQKIPDGKFPMGNAARWDGSFHPHPIAENMVRPAGFEPATYGFEVRNSIQLSYRRF